jgi:hypothetical protein
VLAQLGYGAGQRGRAPAVAQDDVDAGSRQLFCHCLADCAGADNSNGLRSHDAVLVCVVAAVLSRWNQYIDVDLGDKSAAACSTVPNFVIIAELRTRLRK